MKNKVLLGVGILIMMGLSGCARANAAAQEETQKNKAYHKITAADARDMMDNEDVTIVDVRTLQEYKEGHVPGAVNIPNEEIADTELELLSEKEDKILVYCRSGRRSKEAADKLIKMGYSQVYDFGGIIDWTYETVKEE